jgi:hypothetical protein
MLALMETRFPSGYLFAAGLSILGSVMGAWMRRIKPHRLTCTRWRASSHSRQRSIQAASLANCSIPEKIGRFSRRVDYLGCNLRGIGNRGRKRPLYKVLIVMQTEKWQLGVEYDELAFPRPSLKPHTAEFKAPQFQ